MNALPGEDNDEPVRITLRLPKDVHDALRNYAYVVGQSGNAVLTRATIEFLAAHRDELVGAAFQRSIDQHKAALEALAKL